MKKRWRDVGGLAVLLVAGCAVPLGRHVPPLTTVSVPLVWPAPPLPARIQFVKAVSSAQDLGIRPPWWQRLIDQLVGSEQAMRLVRPTGVAAIEQTLYVADPGAQAVWVFDLAAKRVRQIQRAGEQRLVSPVAVTIGPRRQVYVADSYLAELFLIDDRGKIRRVAVAQPLQRPAGLAYDPGRERLYVADSAAHTIWIFTADGTLAGSIGHRGTGPGEFNFPTHLTLDRDGTLYVTDALGFRIQMFHADGRVAGQWGRHGDSSGELASPKGIAVDAEGHLYVADALFDTIQIFDQAGRLLLNFGQHGEGPGEFWLPNGLFIDAQQRIYVADAYNRRIQLFEYLGTGE